MGLFGMENRGIGTVRIDGKPYHAGHPKQAFLQGLALLPQNRYRFGLVGLRPVRENVTYTIIDRLAYLLGIIRLSTVAFFLKFIIRLDLPDGDGVTMNCVFVLRKRA